MDSFFFNLDSHNIQFSSFMIHYLRRFEKIWTELFFFCTHDESILDFYIENTYTFLSPFPFFIQIFFVFCSFLLQIFEKKILKKKKRLKKCYQFSCIK